MECGALRFGQRRALRVIEQSQGALGPDQIPFAIRGESSSGALANEQRRTYRAFDGSDPGADRGLRHPQSGAARGEAARCGDRVDKS